MQERSRKKKSIATYFHNATEFPEKLKAGEDLGGLEEGGGGRTPLRRYLTLPPKKALPLWFPSRPNLKFF